MTDEEFEALVDRLDVEFDNEDYTQDVKTALTEARRARAEAKQRTNQLRSIIARWKDYFQNGTQEAEDLVQFEVGAFERSLSRTTETEGHK